MIVSGVTTGMVYSLVALGYHLIFRATRLIDFAQGEKVAVGGLLAVSIMAIFGVDLWVALLLATVIALGLGWIYERLVLRQTYDRDPVVQIIATIGVAQLLYHGHGLIWGSQPTPFPHSLGGDATRAISVGGVGILLDRLWLWALVLAVVVALHLFFTRTLFGQAMVAAADNEHGAKLSGIDVQAVRSRAVSVATALAVLGGIIIAPFTLAGGSIGIAISVKAFAGAMLGGLESAIGVVVGSILIGVIESLTAGLFSYGYRDPIAYSVLLIILLMRPQGIFGRRAGRKG
jgi:branched-chain amino acid transport system permease protein